MIFSQVNRLPDKLCNSHGFCCLNFIRKTRDYASKGADIQSRATYLMLVDEFPHSSVLDGDGEQLNYSEA